MKSEDYRNHVYGLIFCGGGGTRLWPFSRQETPKQFLPIKGSKSLIKDTYERVNRFLPPERIWVVTIPDYTDEVKNELPDIPKNQVLVEPARRDTLLAAGLGVVRIMVEDPDAIIANLWSDQIINNKKRFKESLLLGAKVADEKKTLVTTGVKPTYAHPGLEYVKKGSFLETYRSAHSFDLKEFIERPSRSGGDVNKLIKDKSNLWHIGLWIWRADVFMNSVKASSPETYIKLIRIKSVLESDGDWKEVVKEYKSAPVVQIDMVISKHKDKMYVVEGSFEWLDLGDFQVMWKMTEKDGDGNAFVSYDGGSWIGVDTKDSLVLSKGKRIVGTVGLKDMIVVAVGDAVVVLPRNRAQEVKKIVNWLKENKREYL